MVVVATATAVSNIGVDGIFTAKWEGMGGEDQGEVVAVPYGFVPKAVQVVGVASGATVTFEGCIDGETLEGVDDVDGVAITFATEGLVALGIDVPYFAPKTAGGDGETDLDVYLSARREG